MDPSRNSINDQNYFHPQDPDIDNATHEIQQELPHFPTSPFPNHDSGELPCLSQPESEPVYEVQSLSNDENGEMLDGDDEDDTDANDSDLELPSVNLNDPWPQPTLPMLALAKNMIDNIKVVRLKDDLDEEMLAKLKYPPEELEVLDDTTLFSICIFNDLVSCSERVYQAIRATIQRFTGHELNSHHVVKTKIEGVTGVTQLRTDMCINSCVAFAGPLKELNKCPKCSEDRFKENRRTKKMEPWQQFYTIPLGPQIQAMWRTPEGADRMRYRNRKTAEIIQTVCATGKIPTFVDIVHGSEYLDACRAGKIIPDDTHIMISIDGAQLYCDKELDCWFGICVILNLSPDQRYKKQFVLPAFFVPGPNKPDNVESFLLPTF